MSKPLAGVRVLEIAAWTFVPAAGAIMADLGAEVIKVEPPEGEPQRALRNLLNLDKNGPNPFLEIPNRGKKSITVDLQHPKGRDVVLDIARNSDVFLTSYLPKVRTKMGIDVKDIRGVNEKIIYVRGTGWGSQGPYVNVGGYDAAAAYATSGLGFKFTLPGKPPLGQPAAFFDLAGGNTIAGAISTALFHRLNTGESSIVDVSLMNVGMWQLAPDIVMAPFAKEQSNAQPDRFEPGNPLTNTYPTKDGRWLTLVLLQADRFWAELCKVIGRENLIDDERFKDAAVRYQNRRACVEALDEAFTSATLAEWQKRFEGFSGVWAPYINFAEVHQHPQIEPNGFLPEVEGHDGNKFRLVAPPAHFNEVPTAPAGPAPEIGQHTEEILLDSGLDWDQIGAYRESGVLG